MREKIGKLKPMTGFSPVLLRALNAVLAVMVFAMVNLSFTPLAVALVLISKWRMFAVKPRHWLANIRANLVDLSVGLSVIVFLEANRGNLTIQLLWIAAYGVWLVFIKSLSSTWGVLAQAMIAQLLGLVAFYWRFRDTDILIMLLVTWLICYAAARHFVLAFDEAYSRAIAHVWAFFGVQLAWILGHWMIFYGFMPQIALLLTVIGYGLGAMYYLDKTDKLTTNIRLQFYVVMSVFLVLVLVFSDWQDKTI